MVIASNLPVKTRSKVEDLKERSQNLREPVTSELLLDTDHFTEDAVQILKFHGSYQQYNREAAKQGQGKHYDFMLRTRSPGGFIPPELYLTLDRLADQYGNHTIRATTRQGFQLHGILKKDLKATIAAIVQSLGSTLGACGDLNRNVMAPPAPYRNRPDYAFARQYANDIADLLTPQTGAYYEIWLDGEKAVSAEERPEVVAARQSGKLTFQSGEEPIYGTQYLPRKFKCSVTVPGDNSVDLFSQDLSLVVITDSQGQLEGFNVYAGGGLGRTHRQEETFPRIADEIGFVDKADVFELVKAVVAVQRDYGDRLNRRHARMKYLIEDWGVAKFRSQVEEALGKSLKASKKLPPWQYKDFLGWQEQGDGRWFVGISIQNGRVKDEGDFQLKQALRTIVEKYQVPLLLTPSQDVLLYDIQGEDKENIQSLLTSHGIASIDAIDPLVRYSMACPALPTCGLATTESERVIPSILGRIRSLLDRVGLPEASFVVRMTGCPNGCARPYLAEVGLVGNGPEQYQVWLGASPNQTRLAQVYLEKMPVADLESTFEPLLVMFKKKRRKNESFGDFCDRTGFEALRDFAANYDPNSSQKTNSQNRQRWRVELTPALHNRLKDRADIEGKALRDLAEAALEAYLTQAAAVSPTVPTAPSPTAPSPTSNLGNHEPSPAAQAEPIHASQGY
jgi:sulfite reductase (ferredoxin)